MARQTLYDDLDLVSRGYKINPDWYRNFREESDKITKVIDQILDMSVREYVGQERTMLQDVYFTKYWGWDNYCLVYRMREDYDNLEVLFGAVLESTDNVLRWYDMTEFVNFNVYIITPYRTFRLTYLDLLYEYVTMSHQRVSQEKINSHPRIQKMKEWASRYKEYERITKKNSLNHNPYTYNDITLESRELLRLRNDNRPIPQEYRGLGIQPVYSDYIRGGESFYQQSLDRQQRMSQLINGSYRQEEEPIVTVTQRVSKLNKLLNKLKL